MLRFKQALNLENLATPATAVSAGIGVSIGPYIDFIYGAGNGRRELIYALCFIVFLDWISGVRAAKKNKTYSSEYGIGGVFRTLFLLSFPSFANLMDVGTGTSGILFYGSTLALIYHNFKSAAANTYRAGWGKWFPKQLVDWISSELEAKAARVIKQKKGVNDASQK